MKMLRKWRAGQYLFLSGRVVFLGGNCPGKEESAEKNHNSRSAKGPQQGSESDPKMRKERARRLARALRRLGYDVAITPITLSP